MNTDALIERNESQDEMTILLEDCAYQNCALIKLVYGTACGYLATERIFSDFLVMGSKNVMI